MSYRCNNVIGGCVKIKFDLKFKRRMVNDIILLLGVGNVHNNNIIIIHIK